MRKFKNKTLNRDNIRSALQRDIMLKYFEKNSKKRFGQLGSEAIDKYIAETFNVSVGLAGIWEAYDLSKKWLYDVAYNEYANTITGAAMAKAIRSTFESGLVR